MRRFYGLLVLLFFCLPFSTAVVGCKHAVAPDYCNSSLSSGPVAGQITNIAFAGNYTTNGESLNYGQIGSSLSASATDCFGTAVSVTAFTYGSSNMSIADINPANGEVCAGTWNRNTGGGVPDYSVCTPPANVTSSNATPRVAYVTASAGGATSNPIAIYVHPGVTSVTIGSATPTASCATAVGSTTGDPSSNCCASNSSLVTTTLGPYTGVSCVSQTQTAQLVARVYAGDPTNPANNITCQVGHITFSPQSASSVVSVDVNGVATAEQPGSATILATVANGSSASTAGFFSTCPPASITLAPVGVTGSSPYNVSLNNAQALTATVLDTNGATISGLPLEFVTTSPQTVTAGSNTLTPSFPGAATVTAICQPGSCNPSPFSQIGYLGNGKPITSNGVAITTAGTSSNQVFVASTQSEFFYAVDFTTGSVGAVYKLPFVPNSLVSTVNGATLYLGSDNVLMSVSTANLAVSTVAAVQGTVLAVSPDSTTLVIADQAHGTTSLYSNAGALQSTFNGVGTRAQWTPDSSTVYIAAPDPAGKNNLLLVHNTFTGWTSTQVNTTNATVSYQDVAVTVPSYGAYFAGNTDTEGRSYCATSVIPAGSTTPPSPINTFYPVSDTETTAVTTRVAATNDGGHIIGAGINTAGGGTAPSVFDILLTPPTNPTDPRLTCPTATAGTGGVTFTSTDTIQPLPIPATSTFTGVVPSSNSAIAFFNYSVPTGTPTGVLPYYLPGSQTVGSITLNGTATAPVAGVFSSDDTTFYTTTATDNALHIVSITGSGAGTTVKDTGTIALNLTQINGTAAVPNLIAARVRRTNN